MSTPLNGWAEFWLYKGFIVIPMVESNGIKKPLVKRKHLPEITPEISEYLQNDQMCF